MRQQRRQYRTLHQAIRAVVTGDQAATDDLTDAVARTVDVDPELVDVAVVDDGVRLELRIGVPRP